MPFESVGGEKLTVHGVIRSSNPGGTGEAAAMLQVVCAPMGGSTCANGTVSAGETVCKLASNYNSSTGVLTFVDVKKVGLANSSAPTVSDNDIAGGTCTLPPGGGVYSVTDWGAWNEAN